MMLSRMSGKPAEQVVCGSWSGKLGLWDAFKFISLYIFANALRMHKSSVIMHSLYVYSYLVEQFPRLLHNNLSCLFAPNFLSWFLVSVCVKPVWECFILHRIATMSEAVEPLSDLSFIHGIITKSLLNLLGRLNLNIDKLLVKMAVIFLLDAFGHLKWKRKSDERLVHVCTLGVTACNRCNVPAWNFSCKHRKDDDATTHQDFVQLTVVLVGRNKVGYSWTHLV